ncbi:hypothetical protein ACHQM5_009463 [Ranunculus cassubicifolius]
MSPKILSWNLRGVGSKEKKSWARKMRMKWRASMVLIQESKVEVVNEKLARQLWGGDGVGFRFASSVGRSGGMICLWDKECVEVEDFRIGKWVCSLRCRFKGKEEWCVVSNVYGPRLEGERWELWKELEEVRGFWDGPWCIGGDFNAVRREGERRGEVGWSKEMEEFSEFVENNELVDLPMIGRKYTWARGGRSLSMSRLDRFIVSSEWVKLFPHSIVASIPKPISDHCPILLDCERTLGG